MKDYTKEIDNLIFPSKEDDGIEHVDESYEGFMKLIKQALTDTKNETLREVLEEWDMYCTKNEIPPLHNISFGQILKDHIKKELHESN